MTSLIDKYMFMYDTIIQENQKSVSFGKFNNGTNEKKS